MKSYTLKTPADGVQLLYLPSSRFKTTRVTIRFALDLNVQTVAAFAAVPGLLRYTSAAYPNNMLTERKLASLYGAEFSAIAGKLADTQILSFTVSVPADRFAFEGESIGSECFGFLLDAIFSPDLDENGLFKEENLRREKRLMREAVLSEMGDKMLYAVNRYYESIFQGEGAGIPSAGTPEQIDALRVEDVSTAWKSMLETARVMVCVSGEVPLQAYETALRDRFSAIHRRYRAPKTAPHPARTAALQVKETQPLEQCKLNIGFAFSGENKAAARMFNIMFGGSFMSKLSKQVRETLGLCYYCSSSLGLNKKVISVFSGVESAQKHKASEAVLEQLRALQKGDFTEEEFQMARVKLKENYSNFDSQRETVQWYVSQILEEQIETPEEAWQAVSTVTPEEVTAFAKTLTLDTVYALGDHLE